MRGNTNFEPELSEMSFPHPHKAIPFFWLIDLYYKKLYYYTFNLINKNFVEICFLYCYNYTISLILPKVP